MFAREKRIMDGIYVNSNDEVVCTSCNLRTNYDPGSDALIIHLFKKKDCNLLKKRLIERQEKPRQFASFDSLKYEDERLATFIDWPIHNRINPQLLAENGFFFLRVKDKCACIFCGVIIQDWLKKGYVTEEHAKYNCPFVKRMPVGNVNAMQCNILNTFFNPPLVPPTIEEITFADESLETSYLNKRLMNPRLVDFLPTCQKDRLSTYKELSWPINHVIEDEHMAIAGFSYTGVSDHVRCYSCGLGLRNWRSHHNPMVEHIYAYPQCPFVTECVSLESINSIKNPQRRRYGTNYYISNDWMDILIENDITKTLRRWLINEKDIRYHLKLKLERTGVPFLNVDSFVRQLKYFRLEIVSPKGDLFFSPCEHWCYEKNDDKKLDGLCPICRNKYDYKFYKVVNKDIDWVICDKCNTYWARTSKELTDKVRTLCDLCLHAELMKYNLFCQSKKCSICGKNDRRVTLTPCSHSECCRHCAEITHFCPLCFSIIENKYIY